LGGFCAETFEAALGVVQPRQDQQPNDEVDGPSAQMPVGRFVVSNGAGRFTRTDGDVEISKRWRNEFLYFFDGHGEIGVANKTILAARLQHALSNCIAFAALLFLANDQIWMVQGKFLRECEGVVGTPIFHNDDFKCETLLLQEIENLPKRARQAALFIVSRYNDG